MKRQLKALPKPPVEIVADYIRAIYKHAISEISNTVPTAYMAVCRKEYVLSGKPKIRGKPNNWTNTAVVVPAVWSDAAKNATLQVRSDKKQLSM
jgi:hypothetical protein